MVLQAPNKISAQDKAAKFITRRNAVKTLNSILKELTAECCWIVSLYNNTSSRFLKSDYVWLAVKKGIFIINYATAIAVLF